MKTRRGDILETIAALGLGLLTSRKFTSNPTKMGAVARQTPWALLLASLLELRRGRRGVALLLAGSAAYTLIRAHVAKKASSQPAAA